MNIQLNSANLALYGAGKVLPRRSNTDSSSQSPQNAGVSAKPIDKVTISSTAKEMAEIEGIHSKPRTAAQQQVLNSLNNDSSDYEEMAYGMAHIPSQVCYDISSGEIRLASTGQSMEDEGVRNAYVANFKRESSFIDAKLLQIYDTEKAKGSDSKTIIAAITDFKNARSGSYLDATAFRSF